MSEILPCPYCGGIAMIDNNDYSASVDHFRFWVFCQVCAANGSECHTESEAIAAWNEVAGLKVRITELEQVSMAETDLKKSVEGFCAELKSMNLNIVKFANENAELKAKVKKYERIIGMTRLGMPVSFAEKQIEQRDRELAEGKTQRPLESDPS